MIVFLLKLFNGYYVIEFLKNDLNFIFIFSSNDLLCLFYISFKAFILFYLNEFIFVREWIFYGDFYFSLYGEFIGVGDLILYPVRCFFSGIPFYSSTDLKGCMRLIFEAN